MTKFGEESRYETDYKGAQLDLSKALFPAPRMVAMGLVLCNSSAGEPGPQAALPPLTGRTSALRTVPLQAFLAPEAFKEGRS